MSNSPPSPAAPSPPDVAYTRRDGRFDEGVDASGAWRGEWGGFITSLGKNATGRLQSATEACRRAILEQDVSMNVYEGAQSDARPWPLDVVPLLLGPTDWEAITTGLKQRAHLYNGLLQDLYGSQRLLKHGLLPAPLAMANPNFLRACVGLARPRTPFLHTYAADVARSPDGRWWVIEDRLDAPSGLGYSLQNRIIVRQVLADSFHGLPVMRLYRFLRQFRESLESLNPRSDAPRVAFLTPGTANETYFEQAYLARYLGYPLVEGEDLLTRDRKVFLRTVGGLQRIDTLVRRVDSEFCDPLELNEQSLLGVPGLVHAAQSGRVALANQLGARALESTALLAFLEPLCRQVLEEDLAMPSAATWWCGQPSALEYVLENLHALVIKPTFPTPGAPRTRYGALLDRRELDALAGEIRARPWAWCGQERVFLGTTPGWDAPAGHLRAMPFVTRIFLAWVDGDYVVMPGGLTRCNPSGEEGDISLQAGSITKDTWVVAPDSPDARTPAIALPPATATRHATALPSRLADHLFWLGRYIERTSALARIVERMNPLLSDEVAVLDPGVAEDAARLVLDLQQLLAPPAATIDDIAALARRNAADPAQPGSLAANLVRLTRVLETVKVRLPREAWQIARELRHTPLAESAPDRVSTLRSRLAALDGVLAETLPRDTGWRFLDLGRSIERGCQTLFVLKRMLGSVGESTPTEFRLQTALHLADSLFAFRAVHHGTFAPVPVFDWLVCDAENARGLRYLAERISTRLGELPDDLAPAAVAALRDRAFRLLSSVRLADTARLAGDPLTGPRLWLDLHAMHADLSNRLTQVYFTHIDAPERETD